MEYQKLKRLVDQFWEGNCTDEEEALLHEYFRQDFIQKEFQYTADYFKYARKENVKLSLNDDFDEKILQRIHSEKRKPGHGLLLRIAAGLVILLSLYIGYESFKSPAPEVLVTEDSYDNPEQAYNEVKKALLLVSGKMNKGTSYGNQLKKFSHANNSIRYEKEIKQ